MGISNYVPSSRVSQAGVCTSSTRPASPYEGQMIYETDTNRVLVYDNTAWVMIADTDTPPGMELIKASSFTSSSNMLMESVFSSTYDNYRIHVNIQSVSAGTSLFMRLANGSTVDASSIYLYGGFISYMGSGILTAINGSGVTTDWLLAVQDNTYGYGNTPLVIDVMSPYASYKTAIFSHGFQPVNPLPYYRHLGGLTSNSTSYNGFTIIPNSNSFNMTGTIKVFGYRNS
jgi:hypothetical protein